MAASKFLKRAIASTATLLLALGSAQGAVVVNKDLTNPGSIPGLTGFATSGAMMSGLEVTATFSNGLSQTLAWGTTGALSGGVTGAGWGLSLNGDSFGTPWEFTIDANANLGQLVQLILDGSNALTILDATLPSPGTTDSAQGMDFNFFLGCGNCDATATYSEIVGVGAAAPVNDLFQRLVVDFTSGTGPRADWSFVQDTDNDSRFNRVPEPGALGLVGLALAAAGLSSRRRKA